MPKNKSSKNGLTPQQEFFCREYIIDLNGTQAAIRAGYSERTANEQAAQLLAKLSIKKYVQKLKDKRSIKLEITAEKVLQEYAKVAFIDIREFYKSDGSLKSPNELSDNAAACTSEISVFEEFSGVGENREKTGETKKLKLHSKIAALDSLGKHLGIFQKDNEQKPPIIVAPDIKVYNSGPPLASSENDIDKE